MPKYILLYAGEATDPADMSEEDRNAVMEKWRVWMEGVGSALGDVGSPFGPGTSLVDDGSRAAPTPMTGYSIVEAADLDAACGLADGHPYLSDGGGKFAINVFELMPVPSQI